jgi:phenylacetate-CoA ligase
MFLAGIPVCMALAQMGVCAIPVGAEAGTAAILKYARLFRPRGMFCTPSLAEYTIEIAEREGIDLRDLGIRIILCGGEPGAAIPSVRQRIETAFGARLFDFAGGLGASCGCPEYAGMHWVVGDLAIMELVDPATHELLPFEHGAEGLAAFTPLEAPGLLGIRQTNGDLMRVYTRPCVCGQTGWRYEIIGRADDMLKVKGVMVYPVAIEGVIKSFVPRVTGGFRIVLAEPPPRVVPPLVLKMERGVETRVSDLAALESEILDKMQRELKIRPMIKWLAPDTLPRSAKKTQLFEKVYES